MSGNTEEDNWDSDKQATINNADNDWDDKSEVSDISYSFSQMGNDVIFFFIY